MHPRPTTKVLATVLAATLCQCTAAGSGTEANNVDTPADNASVDAGSDGGADSTALQDAAAANDTTDAAEAPLDSVPDAIADAADSAQGSPDADGVTYQGDAVCAADDAGQLVCCEPGQAGGVICAKAKPAFDAATGGCDAGHFDAGGICIENNCSAVGSLLAQALHEDIIPGGQSCSQDSDCTAVDFSTACSPACHVGVAKDKASAYAAAVKAFDDAVCVPYDIAAACQMKGNPNCAAAPTPGCVKGTCSAYKKFPTNDCALPAPTAATCYDGTWTCAEGQALHPLGDTCYPATCQAVGAAVDDWVAMTMAQAGPCAADADCTVTTPLGVCNSPCPLPLTLAAKTLLQQGKSSAGPIKTYCKEHFVSVGCVASKACALTNAEAAALGARCEAGACVFNAKTPTP